MSEPFSGSKLFDEHKESSEFSKNKTEKFGNLQREQIQEQDEFAGISLLQCNKLQQPGLT